MLLLRRGRGRDLLLLFGPFGCRAGMPLPSQPLSLALQVVAMLNGQQMGGKRRSAYFYDLWCLKYLPKFKWDHLTGGCGWGG